MRALVLTVVVLLAACPKKEPQEPTPPPPADAAAVAVDADLGPAQSPQASTAIRATSYPQNCERDTDCIAVFEGNACDPCRCAWNAIRVDAFAKYKADLGGFWSCHKPDDCKITCTQKIGDAAKCDAGTCSLPPQ